MPPRGGSIAPPPLAGRLLAGPRRGLPRERPILLGSVASADEAAVALRLPVGIVDLKDPRDGVLAACRPEVWRAAAVLRDRIAPRTLLSAALGDTRRACDTTVAASRAALASSLGFDFVKVGLAGNADDALGALRAIVAASRAAPGEVFRSRVIAVACVDAATPSSLRPLDLPRVASLAGADGCLLDTAVKDGRSLTDHVSLSEVAGFVGACRSLGLLAALAGSLAVRDLPRLVPLGPDVIGARGALCREGRAGRLDPRRINLFHDSLRAARRSIASAGRPDGQAAAPLRRPAFR